MTSDKNASYEPEWPSLESRATTRTRIAGTHHCRDGKVAAVKLLGEVLHLTTRVAEDDRLRDRQRLVQVAQGVQLPLLALHLNVELADTYLAAHMNSVVCYRTLQYKDTNLGNVFSRRAYE